jgi:hypothetical protein
VLEISEAVRESADLFGDQVDGFVPTRHSRSSRACNYADNSNPRPHRREPTTVEEVGYLPLDRAEANMVFQLVSRRYERGTMIITSNKSFAEWGGVLGDDVLATAILDRLLHHCDVIFTNGM